MGAACALLFAERGFDVVVNYSKSRTEAEATAAAVMERGRRALVVQANVAEEAAVKAMVDAALARFGRLDVLVNNAATTKFITHTDLDSLTEAVWDEILGVNLKGAYFVTKAAMPALRATGGAVVNVASVAGIRGSGSSVAYAASKGGLITMTKSLATAFGPTVRVNAVCPGPIDTRWMADHQDMIEAAMPTTPLGKACSAEDVARVVVYLALDATMMTGQAVVVDGGRTV
ncbi:MAG: SDR family NAD(P)-dependent oxidoreductase [Planctomycetia bacterium]